MLFRVLTLRLSKKTRHGLGLVKDAVALVEEGFPRLEVVARLEVGIQEAVEVILVNVRLVIGPKYVEEARLVYWLIVEASVY